ERRLKIEKLLHGGPMIESLEQSHAASAEEPAVQAVAEGVNVEKGESEEEAVVAGDPPAVHQINGVRREVVMGENRSLGRAGGAGGVDDRRGRVAVERFGRPLRRTRFVH